MACPPAPVRITHVLSDDPLIKVYGICDDSQFAVLEKVLDCHFDKLRNGEGAIRTPSDASPGNMVLVPRFHKYRRAEILHLEDGGKTAVVQFLDIGGKASYPLHDLRLVSAITQYNLTTFPVIPPTEYFLANALKINEWTPDAVETINAISTVIGQSLLCSVPSVIGNHILLNISYAGKENYSSYATFLVQRGFAAAATPEQVKNAVRAKFAILPTQNQHFRPPLIPPGLNQFSVPSTIPNNFYSQPRQPVLPTPINLQPYGIRPTLPTVPIQTFSRLQGPRPSFQMPKTEPIPQNFTSETLLVGSQHEVYVSNVIDGLQNFIVQLKSSVEKVLTPLMVALNDKPAEPFTDPLQPGTVCLGRYAADNALCRAVVSTVLADGANLYFVDFGNSEIVPFNEIYKIRPEFMREKMVAIRFSLAGCADDYTLTTKEAEKVFSNLTMNTYADNLLLKVTKPETPLKQFCELFIKTDGKLTNIKSKVLDKMRMLQPAQYERIPFKKNSQADVVVPYVESPARFFVQSMLNEFALNNVMKEVERYCATSDDKEVLYVEDVNENMAVCALYEADGQWYRALVMNEPDPSSHEVEVLFVDYGNHEAVHFSNLRIMTNEMVQCAPMQAVECRLDFDADLSLRDDVILFFNDLLEGKELAMRVLNVLPAKVLLVDLVDKETNQNIKEILLKTFQPPPVAPPSDPRSRGQSRPTSGAQGNWRERQNSTSGDGDFSAFKTHKPEARNNYAATDETDNMNKVDSWDKRDRFSSRDSAPKRFNRNDDEQTDSWSKKPSRQEDSWNNSETTSRWSQHDDRTNAENDGGGRSFKARSGRDDNGWPSRDNDGFKSRGRDNDRDGGRSFNRDDRWGNKSGDSWNSNRGGDDEGRKPYQKQDTWAKNDNFESKNDSWDSKKKDDDWSGNRRGGDSSWGDNRRGDRDSKPSFGNREDRGENRFREKRDFGGGWKNDNDSGGRRDDNRSGGWKNESNSGGWGAPKTPSLEPAYERGATFVEPDYQPGQELQVITTWFVNPSQFFVMPVENNEFRTMMDSFQEDYSRRQPIDLNSLSPNECVVARDKDDVIYRAKFLRGRPGGAIVTFVDYGNTATVKKDQVWAVSQDHCTIPIQAFNCKLHDISPVDENTPWAQVGGVDKFFEGDSYTLTLVECIDDGVSKTWSVHLLNAEGANIGDSLVESGLAVRKNVLKSEELFDLSLLKNQVLAVFPGAVISSKKFFLHLDPETAQVIGSKIKEFVENPDNLVSLPAEEIVEGKFCLTCSDDDEYYRSLILSVESAAETARIVFIDYGDENEIAFSQVKVLPDHLCVYNAQIAECCLYGGENFEQEESFSEAVVNNDLFIKVVDVIDDKLHVILYDVTSGNRLPFPEETDEKVPPLCALPILKLNDAVAVSHIGKGKVFIQRVADESCLTSFSDRMFAVYDAQEVEKVALEVDKFYAAKSGKFETWYRCKAADSECQEVFYIDYGNTESVEELIALKPLEEEFFASFMFCVGVSTSAHFTAEDLTPLIDGVAEVVFNGTFKPVESGEWYVDLVCQSTSKTLADFAVETGCGEPVQPSTEEPPAYSVFPTWNLSEEKTVKISNVDTPDCIHLQSVEDEPKLVTIQEKLRTSLKRILPLYGPYDDLIAAQKGSDKEWYRARPLSGDEVFAIDFGYTFKPLAVKKLPNSFKQDKSNFITPCALNIQPSEGDSWSQEVISRLVDLAKNATQVTAKLEFIKHHVKYVDISTDGSSVGEVFVADGIAAYKAHDILISHPNSIKDFYVQFSEDLDEIYALLEKLKEAETWESVEPEADKVFAAQFVDDEQWYRAVIANTQEDGGKIVKFIDYGNEGSSTQFKALPNDLQTLPPYAIQCCQYTTPDDADEQDDLFIEYIDSAEGYFSVYVVSGGQPMMIMLEHNGKHIDQILKDKKMLLEWKLEPANIGEKVVVSHINSPSSFYVRNESAALEEVETALAELDSAEPLTEFAVDDIVAAKFPDDGLWYRAKIIEIVETNTTVSFFDYGNTSEVTEVRSLPDGAKLTPCSAKHCSFAVPAEQGEWPDVASDRFAELNCDGDTVFDVTIKEDGDPAVVDLFDHGNSVAEELATICKADLTAPTRESSKEVVILSHVAGMDSLWIQSQSPQLDEMVNEMANVETFDDLESANVGMLVAAQFEEEWYRATVLEELESGYKVLFIDYGNESDVTMIKSLPEDLATLTPLAKCCQLKNVPADIETTVPDVLEKLQEFVDQASTFYVDELEESEGLNVVSLSLCHDGKILSQYLLGVDHVAEENSLVPQTVEEVAVEESVNENDTTPEVTAENALTESGVDHVIEENSIAPQTAEEVAFEESVNENDTTLELTAGNALTESGVDHVTKELTPQTVDEVEVEKSVNENDTTLEVTTKSVNEEDITFIEPVTNLNAAPLTADVVKDACVKPSTDSVPDTNLITSTADGAEVLSKEFEKISVTHSPVQSTVEVHAESTESVAPPNFNQNDIELNSSKNGCDETSTEEDNDADYKTPPSKSIDNEIYATPERLLDESSASGELETSYSYSSALSILDLPEYAELFTLSDERPAFENHEFLISHMSNVDNFYIQKYDDLKRVELISKSLKAIVEGGNSTPLINPVVSSLAAAKCNDKWFRVRILEISDTNSSSVLCIDFGNVFSSEELYELPEKLHSLPSLAYCCTLRVSDEMKQKINDDVVEFVHSQNCKVKVEVIEVEDKVYVINLFYDNVPTKLLHPPKPEPSEEKKEEFGNNDQESANASESPEIKIEKEGEAANAHVMPVSEKLPSEPDCSFEAESKLMESSAEFEENEPKIEIEPIYEETSSTPHSSSEIESNVGEKTEIESSTESADEKMESKIVNEESAAEFEENEPKIEIEPVYEESSSTPHFYSEVESNVEEKTEIIKSSTKSADEEIESKIVDEECPKIETEEPEAEQISTENVLEESSIEIADEKIELEIVDEECSKIETEEPKAEQISIEPVLKESPSATSAFSEIESSIKKKEASTETCSVELESGNKNAKVSVVEVEEVLISEKSSFVPEVKYLIEERVSKQELIDSVDEVSTLLDACLSEVEMLDCATQTDIVNSVEEQMPVEKVSETSAFEIEEESDGEHTETLFEESLHFPSPMSEVESEDPKLNEEQIEKTPEKSSCSLSPFDKVVTKEQMKTAFEKSLCSELKTNESVENQKPSGEQTETALKESSSEVEVEDVAIESKLNDEQIEKTSEKSLSPSDKVVTKVAEEEKPKGEQMKTTSEKTICFSELKTTENVENQEPSDKEMKVEDAAEELTKKSLCSLSPADEIVREGKPKDEQMETTFEKSLCSAELKTTNNVENQKPSEEQTETAPKESSYVPTCSPKSNHEVELKSDSNKLRTELSNLSGEPINVSVENNELEPKCESHDLSTESVAEQHSQIPIPKDVRKFDDL